jgi:hypothetical protein
MGNGLLLLLNQHDRVQSPRHAALHRFSYVAATRGV